MFCYLDNSATTKPADIVINEISKYISDQFGNPSSLHGMGISNEKMIKESKSSILKLLKDIEGSIIFTSGGTEANNLAIFGAVNNNKRKGNHIITSKIEHKSVLSAYMELEKQGFHVTYIDVDKNGLIDINQLKKSIRKETILISIMHVNNEIGSVQPIEEISKFLKTLDNPPLFHIDAVQSFMKYELNRKKMGYDMLTFSGHKVGALKGIGGLYLKKGLKLKPIVFGGQQENGIRPGTENTVGIWSLNRALSIEEKNIDINYKKAAALKNHLLKLLNDKLDNFNINGLLENTSPYILNISFLNVKGEVLLHSLEMDDVFVSTGSACNSKSKVFSHVLDSMHLRDQIKEGSIRISLSPYTSIEEIDYAAEKIINHVSYLRDIMGGKKRV